VLILGECGTGKEQLAHYIHDLGAGRAVPMLRVCCGKLATDVGREGSSEIAGSRLGPPHSDCDQSVSWLLEGVGEIPELLQPGFSEFIDLVLSEHEHALHPRIIATANHGLITAMEDGSFRHDLFYKLNVLELHIPPLRERKEDLGPLVEYFLSTVPLRENSPKQFTEEAIAVLSEYHWPGNMVELRNVVSQVCVLSDRPVVDAEQLLKHWQLPQRGSHKDLTGLNLEDAETYLILEAVARCDGNRTAAAKQLGITTRTLQNKMQKYRKLGFVK
jgi:transcriptional regulator with PAS, ATPase and Fis domain